MTIFYMDNRDTWLDYLFLTVMQMIINFHDICETVMV